MLIIDTRSPLEYQTGHVQGAINLPPEMFVKLSWLDRRVGSDTRVPAPVPCP